MAPSHAGKVARVVVDAAVAFGLAHHRDDVARVQQALVNQLLHARQIGRALAQHALHRDDLLLHVRFLRYQTLWMWAVGFCNCC